MIVDEELRKVRLAEQRQPFMAALLRRLHGPRWLEDRALRRALGVSLEEAGVDAVIRLGLCLRPRPDHLEEDIAAIAQRAGVRPEAVRAVVEAAK